MIDGIELTTVHEITQVGHLDRDHPGGLQQQPHALDHAVQIGHMGQHVVGDDDADRAGSLAVLSRFCKKVYALDIDPACETSFRGQFANVDFMTGDSTHTLPALLSRLQAERAPLGFILIDADHSRDGVWRDIESILRYVPERPLYVLMHDSFNPECRRGMREAHWSVNPYVHLVELDFVSGRFVTQEEDGYRQMWCGFALAVLLPERRIGRLTIHENESLLFDTALRHSVYRHERWWNPVYAGRELKYRAKRLLRRRAPVVYDTFRRRLHRGPR